MSRSKQVTLSLAANTPALLISTIGPGWGVRVQSVLVATSGEADISFYDDDALIGGPFAAPVELGPFEDGLFRTGMGGDLFIQASATVSAQITILYVDEPYISSYTPFYTPLPGPQPEPLPLDVATLFAGGAHGVWWDVQDLSTLWQDVAGTVPAVVGAKVNRQDDKSGNGNHRVSTTGSNGPTLRQRADGVYFLQWLGDASMRVPNSQGAFNYLHDGSGGAIAFYTRFYQHTGPYNYLYTSTGTAAVGMQLAFTGSRISSHSVTRGVSGGANRTAYNDLRDGNTSSPTRMHLINYSATMAERYTDTCVSTQFGVLQHPPSTDDAGSPLTVQANFRGEEYSVIILDRIISKEEGQRLYSYYQATTVPKVDSVDLTLILGGQSNMSGRGSLTSELPVESEWGMFTYSKDELFQMATAPEHSLWNQPVATDPSEAGDGAPQHGLAIVAAKSLLTASSKSTLLVPCAIGSTNVDQWNTPEYREDRSTLFGAMVYRYRRAAVKGGLPIIVWYGFESGASYTTPDYTAGGVGTQYQTRFTSLIENVRRYVADAPLIMVQLAADNDAVTARDLASVAEAQRQLEATIPNCYMVVAMDVQRNPSTDDIHVGREGVGVIGERVALAIREHVLGEAVDGTGPRNVAVSFTGDTITLTLTQNVNETSGDYGDLFRVYSEGSEVTVTSANRHNTNSDQITIVCDSPLTAPVTLTYGYRPGPNNAARTDIVKNNNGLPLPVFGPILVSEAS